MSGTAIMEGTKNAITTTIKDFGHSFPQVSCFVAALICCGLDNIISGEENFTLFIPTNKAFAELKIEESAFIGNKDNFDQVKKFLKYHFIPQLLPSSSLSNGDIQTLNGDSVSIVVTDQHIKVNNCIITKADNLTNNGVIHFIDHLLHLPSTYSIKHQKNKHASVEAIKSLRKFVKNNNNLNDSIDSDFFDSESSESIDNDDKDPNYKYKSDKSSGDDTDNIPVCYNCEIY